ncbi:MAG: nuclear transport factor 2 family protein, partial [Candidatus Acidiferrales bacterium]
MTRIALSRRNLLATGACALVGAVSLPGPATAGPLAGQNLTNEEIVRKWYAAWGQKDWGPLDNLLADDFTFSSAAGDDHISKSAFKKQCWETQINFIGHFDLERVATGPNDAFVKYL